jgi:YHS domain-containing protein
MFKTLLTGIVALTLAGSVVAQDGAPGAPARRQGQGQGQRMVRVQVCTMNLEVLKTPRTALKVDFQGKQVPFCCEACKVAFEKLDDAGKEKAAKRADLTGRKLGLQRQLEQVEKQLKELEPEKVVDAAPAGKLFCAITEEEIESVEKAAGKIEFNGKTYYFCCGGCVKKFEGDKARYAKLADEAAAKRGN